MRTSIVALATAAAALAGTAYAQQQAAPPKGGDPMGQATVTRAEAGTKAGAMFDRLDANHDGKLDQADRAARTAAMFDKMDANHDGALSREEFAAAHERMGGPGRGRMEHAGMEHGDMEHAAPPPPPPGMTGAPLTRAAFVAEGLKRFDAADSNRDGKLTPAERRAARQARHKGGMHGRMMMPGGPDGPDGADMPPPPPPAG